MVFNIVIIIVLLIIIAKGALTSSSLCLFHLHLFPFRFSFCCFLIEAFCQFLIIYCGVSLCENVIKLIKIVQLFINLRHLQVFHTSHIKIVWIPIMIGCKAISKLLEVLSSCSFLLESLLVLLLLISLIEDLLCRRPHLHWGLEIVWDDLGLVHGVDPVHEHGITISSISRSR